MATIEYVDPEPAGAKAILFLHGLGADGSSWLPQLQAFSRAGYRPITVDLPGFGNSPYDGRGWTIKRVASELVELLDELKTGAVCLVGLSLGGVVAQQFAIDFPAMLQRLVLVSTFAVLRPENLSQWSYFIQRAAIVHLLGIKAQAEIVAGRVFPGDHQETLRRMVIEKISGSDPRAYRAAMRSLGIFDSRRKLARIKVPTLVISGEEDSTVSPARQQVLVDGIPNARYVVIPNAGHAVNIDQHEMFNQAVLEFISNI
ncbi:MAG: alpha/beta fold hydrolase [Anaerolineales bacterium]|nr:alpha/beta fold hydrolase [Anaerolineales bacterium]